MSEIYVSTDVEADGPIPGPNLMLLLHRWHEVHRVKWAVVTPSKNRVARLYISRSEDNPNLFEAHFRRRLHERASINGRDGWEVLFPHERIIGNTQEEAKERALSQLEALSRSDGIDDEDYETRPLPPPLADLKVKVVDHPSHRAFAFIYKHTDSRYEVRYFGEYLNDPDEPGWRLSIPTPENIVVPKEHELLSFAHSLEAAEALAADELELIVRSSGRIRPR